MWSKLPLERKWIFKLLVAEGGEYIFILKTFFGRIICMLMIGLREGNMS
jgi:hypothetical protein